jgi:ubiquinone/menaquinone biosynthesis C-methylase UbiE
MSLLKKLADNSHPDGFGTKMRLKRHAFFVGLISSIHRPIEILDVGGTELYWNTMGMAGSQDLQITLLNLEKKEISSKNMISIAGDATHMDAFEDQSFDIVFSNSVIEHVGDCEAQRRMAREVARIGKRYFIQTPNYWFPMEPHFLVPGFQWLPIALRVWLIGRFNLGWHQRIRDLEQARDLVHHTRLLTKKEFQSLFPKAKLYEEKIFGLTKSFIMYDGWD